MSVFKDKVVFVTGAGSGIGRALARELAGQGAVVVATDRNQQWAQETAEGIVSSGGKAEGAELDVVDAEAVGRLVEQTASKHGKLDYIFNNAGIGIFAEARDHTLEDWYTTLDINLRGVIHGVNAAYPIMLKQGSGHIVNTASLAGLVPANNEIAYAASKFAVVGLTTTLRGVVVGADVVGRQAGGDQIIALPPGGVLHAHGKGVQVRELARGDGRGLHLAPHAAPSGG